MDLQNELLDAIQVLIDGALRKAGIPRIYTGTITGVNGSRASVMMNGETHDVTIYGNAPTVNAQYPVFIPQGGMSLAFIIVP